MILKIEDTENIRDKIAIDNEFENKLVILPDNFEHTNNYSEFIFPSSTPTITKLLQTNRISFDVLGKPTEYRLNEHRSYEWFAPILFISSLYYTQNPEAVALAISMLANYLTQIFKGKSSESINVIAYVEKEKDKTTKRIEYKGPIEGLEKLSSSIDKIFKDK